MVLVRRRANGRPISEPGRKQARPGGAWDIGSPGRLSLTLINELTWLNRAIGYQPGLVFVCSVLAPKPSLGGGDPAKNTDLARIVTGEATNSASRTQRMPKRYVWQGWHCCQGRPHPLPARVRDAELGILEPESTSVRSCSSPILVSCVPKKGNRSNIHWRGYSNSHA